MNVLHIIDSLGLGGAQTVVKGIFENQKKNKSIFLFSLREREIKTNVDHPNVYVFDSKRRFSFKPLRELRRIISEESIDILHCHLFRAQVFGWILKRFYFPKITLIIHEHGQIFQNNWYYNYLMDKLQNHVNFFIAVSKATQAELIKKAYINKKKVLVLYNFVDLEKFNQKSINWNVQKERQKLGIKKDGLVIGFVGRLSKVKGCIYLIESLSLLDKKSKVLIIGDGPERERLEKIVKENRLQNQVIFLGYREDIANIYSLLDILVMPSLSEASPMAFYESQSFGIPIIGSDVPAINELVINKENGLLFIPRDSKDLAKKISRLHRDKKLRKKISEKALHEIQSYSLKKFWENLEKIYKASR